MPRSEMEKLLISYICGALEDEEAEEVVQRMRIDSDFTQEYKRILSFFRPALQFRDENYQPFSIPQGLAQRTMEFIHAHNPTATVSVGEKGSERHPYEDSIEFPSQEEESLVVSLKETVTNRTQDTLITREKVATAPVPQREESPLLSHSRWRWLDCVVAISLLGVVFLGLFQAVLFTRHEARIAICQDNLMHIGRALQNYANLHDGELPSVKNTPFSQYHVAGLYGPTLLETGQILPRHLFCPDVIHSTQEIPQRLPTLSELKAFHNQEQSATLLPIMGGNYSYDIGYETEGCYYPPRDHRRPQHALLADAQTPEILPVLVPGHGPHGNNILFEDGHVSFQKEMEWNGDNIYLNDLKQIALGIHLNDTVLGFSAMKIR